ncbi:MAG: GtrA family protein [Candidatus Pacebacteria bacterium]|nr:GtrA family protein [Candidatus Paceibacterota bacterium]
MLRLFRYFTQFKLVRFIISGGTSAVVTIGTVFVLTHIYDVWYLTATWTGFLLAVLVNFLLQKFWTFRDRTLVDAHKQSVGFVVVNGINFFVNSALMIFFVEHLDLWPVVAQVCSAVLIACESFIAYSFIFRREKLATPVHASQVLLGEEGVECDGFRAG